MQPIDIATIHACQHGDRAAALRIYDALSDRIYRLAYRYTYDEDRAIDLTQEVFLRVFSRIGTFRAASSLETWAYRVAVNTIVGKLRSERDHDELDGDPPAPRGLTQPERQVANAELGERISCAVADLPPSLHTVFVMVAMEGRSYAEAAGLLDLTIEAVRMRMSRARSRLRDALRPYLSGGDDDDLR